MNTESSGCCSHRSRMKVRIGEAISAIVAIASVELLGWTKRPRRSRCSSPASAQFRIPGNCDRRRVSSSMSSLPSHEVPSVRTMKRLTIAPEASPNSGSSLLITNNLHGSRPVHCSLYLMLTVR